jgi:hypothetical protein
VAWTTALGLFCDWFRALFRSLLSGLSFANLLVLLLEAVYATFGVNYALPSGEKRVAVGAYFHSDVAFVSRTGAERISTRADHIDFVVLRVDPCFHLSVIPFR